MKKKDTTRQLEQLWEKGVERATEEQPRSKPHEQETLNTSAGLHLQSGVKAGNWSDWSSAYTCGGC